MSKMEMSIKRFPFASSFFPKISKANIKMLWKVANAHATTKKLHQNRYFLGFIGCQKRKKKKKKIHLAHHHSFIIIFNSLSSINYHNNSQFFFLLKNKIKNLILIFSRDIVSSTILTFSIGHRSPKCLGSTKEHFAKRKT